MLLKAKSNLFQAFALLLLGFMAVPFGAQRAQAQCLPTPTLTLEDTVCLGDTLRGTASSPGATNYLWFRLDFPAGKIPQEGASIDTPANSVLLSGRYGVVATDGSGSCFSDTADYTALVGDTALTDPIVNDTAYCEGDSAILTVQNLDPTLTYTWTTSLGLPPVQGDTLFGPSIPLVASPVEGYVFGASVAGCISDTDTTLITINPAPTVTAGPDDSFCLGASVNLSASSPTPGATFSWSGPNSYTNATQNPTVTLAAAADYGDYIVSAEAAGCTRADTASLTQATPPAAPNAGPDVATCAGEDTVLSATASGAPTGWEWTLPGGGTQTGQTLNLTGLAAADSGAYAVRYFTAGQCTSAYDTLVLQVITQPQAEINPDTICVGNSASATIDSVPGASFFWQTPLAPGVDVPQRVVNIPSVDSSMIGEYYAYIYFPGVCTTAADTVSPYISGSVSAPTVSPNLGVCLGDSLFLSAVSDPGASYIWSGPNGFSSSQQLDTLLNVTAAQAGLYTVFAVAGACTSTVSNINVAVDSVPPAPVAGMDGLVCSGRTFTLTASGGAPQYNWNGPSGFNTSGASVNILNAQASNAGDYVVTAVNGGCANDTTDTLTLTVNQTPATPTAGPDANLCSGSPGSLTASDVPGASYLWTGPNGFSASQRDTTRPSLAPADSGVYTVRTIANGCTSAVDTQVLVVRTTPNRPTAGTNSTACEGEDVQLTASFVQNASYSWTGPSGFVSTDKNPLLNNVAPSAGGAYSVVAIANGCTSATDNTVLTIIPRPATPLAGNDTSVCNGANVPISASAVAGAAYYWQGPNSFTATSQATAVNNFTPANEGIYQVVAIANGCTSSVDSQIITIYEEPVPSSNSPLCSGDSLFLSSNAIANAVYSWSGPGGYVSANQNDTLTNVGVANSGTYTLSTSVAGCVTGTATLEVVVLGAVNGQTRGGQSTILCEGDSLTLTVDSINGVNYTWRGPNGFSSNLREPTRFNLTPADAGAYSVFLDNGLGCTSDTDTVNITVNPAVPAPTVGNDTTVCRDDSLRLTASSSVPASFSWLGPNNYTSTDSTPLLQNLTGLNSGQYNVFAIANGCTSQAAVQRVTVIDKPDAMDDSTVCPGATVTLLVDPLPGASYSWTGPDTFTSAQQNPTLVNVQDVDSGLFIVTASINGGACTSTPDTVLLNVLPKPPTPVPNDTQSVCVGDLVGFSADPIPGVEYEWFGPNGFFDTIQNPNLPNAQQINAGTYGLRVVDTATGCSSDVANTFLNVNPIPATPVATSQNTQVCEFADQRLLANPATPGYNYFWTGPLGFTSTDREPEILDVRQQDAGTYSVVAIANGCTSTVSSTSFSVVSAPPTPTISTPHSAQGICEGQTLRLNAVGPGGASYIWNGPNGFTSNQQNVVLTNASPNRSGTYSLIAILGGCSSRADSQNITVTAQPNAQIDPAGPFCETEDPIQLTATPPGGSYWDTVPYININGLFDPGLSGPGQREVAYFGSVGACIYSVSRTITVTPALNAQIYPNQDTTLCDLNSFELTADTVGAATFQWFSNGQPLAGQTRDFLLINSSASYSVVTSNGANCFDTSATVDISFGSTPVVTPTISQVGNVLVAAPAANSYQWYRNGAPIAGATQANYIPTQSGTYSVAITNNGCPSTRSNTLDLTITSVDETKLKEQVEVFPNPTNGDFVLRSPASLRQPLNYTLYNLLGEAVYSGQALRQETQLSLENYPGGIYLLEIQGKGGRKATLRIVRR